MPSWVNLCEVVWPIGSVYTSFVSTSPASLIGGTWTKLTNTFLYAANTSGVSGGSNKHTHTYGVNYVCYYGGFATALNSDADSWMLSLRNEQSGTIKKQVSEWKHLANGALAAEWKSVPPVIVEKIARTDNTSTLPPYTTVYCWRRTA